MSWGWRRIVAAFGGLLAVLLIAGTALYSYREFYEPAEYEYSAERYQPARDTSYPSPTKQHSPTEAYDPHCDQPQNRDDADLCAQWAAVRAVNETNRLTRVGLKLASVGFWIAFLGGIFGFVGTIFLVRAFNASREANEIAREAMTAENRAWIEIEILSLGDLRYEEKDGCFRLKVEFRVTNIGQTVALNVSSEIALIADPMIGNRKIGEMTGQFKEFRDRIRNDTSGFLAENLFPGRSSSPREWDTSVQADDVQLKMEGHVSQLYNMALAIGVRYNTIFDGDTAASHQTIQLGHIRKIDDHGRPGLTIVGRNTVLAGFIRLVHPVENLGLVT